MTIPRAIHGLLSLKPTKSIGILALALLASTHTAWAKKEYISQDPLSVANVCADNGLVSTIASESDCASCHTADDPDLPNTPDDRNQNGKIYELFRGSPATFLDKVLATFCTSDQPPDDNPPPEAGDGACGYADDSDYSSAPTEPVDELCYSGTPSTPVVTSDGRYEWSCNGTAEGAASQVCYTLSSNGKQNQDDLTLLPGSTTVPSGKAVKLKTTGGSGKGKIKYRRLETSGTKCRLAQTGKKARLKVKGAGICKIMATKAGDKDYNEVQSAPITITVTP